MLADAKRLFLKAIMKMANASARAFKGLPKNNALIKFLSEEETRHFFKNREFLHAEQ